jgi:hypothetical protein
MRVSPIGPLFLEKKRLPVGHGNIWLNKASVRSGACDLLAELVPINISGHRKRQKAKEIVVLRNNVNFE